MRKAGGGCADDQTNAMLAVVLADDVSLASPQAAKLSHSVARPLPTEPASLGFGGSPLEVISLHRTPALRFRPQMAQTAFLLSCGSLLAAPVNRPQIAAQRPGRVNRVDRRDTLGIVTFGTLQLNEPPSVAATHHSRNADFP